MLDGLFGLGLCAALLSAVLTWMALRYAKWRQLLDLPGQRRSHHVATPRGGGIAIVLTVLALMTLIHWGGVNVTAFAVGSGVLGVALIGWMDDHHSLSAKVRLCVHVAMAAVCAVALLNQFGEGLGLSLWIVLPLSVVWLVGCTNAWNFMDGSNGLLTSQCVWLGLTLSWVFFHWIALPIPTAVPWMIVSFVLAMACLGFLPFNFPRASIFLGDVGSGALGILSGCLLLAAFLLEPTWWPFLLLLPSVLLVDSAMTLSYRVVTGRRWYTAHREHLYQWLIRSGRSHPQVVLIYMAWNIVIVMPGCLATRLFPALAPIIVFAVLTLSAFVWWHVKRAVWRGARRRGLS